MRFYTLLIAFALIALVIAESSTTSKGETTSGKEGSTSGTETTGGSSTGERDGDKVSDDGNAEYDRTIQKTNDNGDDVEFESRDKAGLSENKLKFRITTQDGEVEVRLQLEGRDDNGKAKSQFRFEVEKIIEYVDNNTVSGYQAGEEVSVIDFTKKQLTWSQIDCFVNGTTYVCEVASTDGQFMLVAYLTSESVIVAGQPVRPTGAKVDIKINKLKRSANTKIAVQIKLASSVEKQTEENESDEQKEGFTKSSEKQVSFGDSAFFSWVKTATINGVTVNVLNSALEQVAKDDVESGEHGNRVIFSFDSTEQGPIVWDPKLSWSADSLTSSVAAVVPCFALLSFFAAMLF